MGAGEGLEVFDPVAGGGRRLEAAQHAVEQRVDQLVLVGEVVVERHGGGLQAGGDGAHRQPVEALARERLGGVEDRLAGQRSALAAGAGVRLARVFGHGP